MPSAHPRSRPTQRIGREAAGSASAPPRPRSCTPSAMPAGACTSSSGGLVRWDDHAGAPPRTGIDLDGGTAVVQRQR
ncbi:DUF6191 domain-containing protein [Kitasatospora sp. NPDC059577]|uniref:DUF6191 domain-containing protein n=1 Tax=unclassified Kitasatospora TaxID=2633591 RepID=UPI00367622DC